MNVGQLISELKKLNPDLPVFAYWEDGDGTTHTLDVLRPSQHWGQEIRLPNGDPALRFGSPQNASAIAIIELDKD